MSTVYLPVEVGRRELMSRAFLAARLANDGHEVFVFVSDFFDRWGWPGPGIYIGKNVFRGPPPHDVTFYKRMKTAGISIWYHDEEGAIFPGSGPGEWLPHLIRRTDVTVMRPDDKVLVWGEFQQSYYEQLGAPPEIHVVGTINFEVYAPRYAHLFADYDEQETRGCRDYILFNTRFVAPNHYWSGRGHAINSRLYTDFMADPERFNTLAEEGTVLYEFIGLIAEVALKFPAEAICLRPHPSENADFYRKLFALLPNVQVVDKGDAGAWIRRSRCVVQNGCTTGLQATVAEKPVITFVPRESTTNPASCSLPNECGTIVQTREEAIAAIIDPPETQAVGRWPMVISCLDTTDKIARLVAADGRPSAIDEKQLFTGGIRSAVDVKLRKAAYRLVPSKQRDVATRERLLDRPFLARFPELVGIANRKWTAPIRIERYSRECYRVRAASRSEPPA